MKIKTDDFWFPVFCTLGSIHLTAAFCLAIMGEIPTKQLIIVFILGTWIVIRSKVYEWQEEATNKEKKN